MSIYNLLFGMDARADLLLAAIGLRKNDVQRFRDAGASEDGKTITIYSRTGGGNREDYPNLAMRKIAAWQGSADDDFDSTYCTDQFATPEEFVEDIRGLTDVFQFGLRKEFVQHLAKTLRRDPTENDKYTAAYEQEVSSLRRTSCDIANGHTFVPYDDAAMEVALKLAEGNDGKLRSYGILPLALRVRQNFYAWPVDQKNNALTRAKIDQPVNWKIDVAYWEHCKQRWASIYPKSMAKIEESVKAYVARGDTWEHQP